MEELLKQLKGVKLFERQPTFTKKDFNRLKDGGLIVAETYKDEGERRKCEVANKHPYDVVSYAYLAEAIKHKAISQDDARRLIALESIRPHKWPRESHFKRLMPIAFAGDKKKVFDKIEELCQARNP